MLRCWSLPANYIESPVTDFRPTYFEMTENVSGGLSLICSMSGCDSIWFLLNISVSGSCVWLQHKRWIDWVVYLWTINNAFVKNMLTRQWTQLTLRVVHTFILCTLCADSLYMMWEWLFAMLFRNYRQEFEWWARDWKEVDTWGIKTYVLRVCDIQECLGSAYFPTKSSGA
jgi:hypothetical protein